MWSLEITKENLENQRNAVQEERRLGLDNQPYGQTFELIDELAYENPAYEHSVIGSMADLSAATVEDVSAFFKTYYAPNNAVVSIVGDVKTAEAARENAQVLRTASRPSRRRARRHDRTASDRRTPPDRRRCARAAAARRHRVAYPRGVGARRRCADGHGRGALERPQLAFLQQYRPAEAVERGRQRVGGDTRGPGLFQVGGTAAARQERRRSREGDLRRDRQAQDRADRRPGSSRRRATTGSGRPSPRWAARCSARSPRPLRVLLERSGSDQHAIRTASRRSPPPTCSAWRSSTSSPPKRARS